MQGYLTNTSIPSSNVLPTTVIDVDFGPLPLAGQSFAVNDPTVTAMSHILAQTALQPGIGKDADEVEMELCLVTPYQIVDGSFLLFVRTLDGSYLEGTFKLNYQVSL